ncbi:MAG: sigma 54-interacting transcriptional regulator [bacterium]|nr:sigma 54-interacting transcriptional regulator [bacterium]
MVKPDSAVWLKQTLITLLGGIDEGIHIINEAGITVYYNSQAGAIDGLDHDAVIDRHILDIYPSLSAESSTLLKVLSTKSPIYNKEQTFTNYKGVRVTTVNSTLPIIVENRLVGAVEISKDYTKVRELSEKYVDLQARAFDKNGELAAIQAGARSTFADIIGQNVRMVELKSMSRRTADKDSTILIVGEAGTGKELFGQAIHNASNRNIHPFLVQNCAVLPEAMLEATLFGTTDSSYSGAKNRSGLLEIAHGGTLFLDEVSSMSLRLQTKLVRVLQEGYVQRIGEQQVRQLNVRLIVAMSMDPLDAIRRGQLQEDLYYRISVVTLRVPPLRQRKEDLSLLIHHFLHFYNQIFGMKVMGLSEEATQIFYTYDWPGNIRELQLAIEGAMNVVLGDVIAPEHLPHHLRESLGVYGNAPSLAIAEEMLSKGASLHQTLAEIEEHLIKYALNIT